MNTTSSTKVLIVAAIAFAAIAAAAFGTVAHRSEAEPQKVVKLERVVIEGKRTQQQVVAIATLPRVVIEGRRSAADTQVASATVCATTAVC